jgi:intein/homing endonuclease
VYFFIFIYQIGTFNLNMTNFEKLVSLLKQDRITPDVQHLVDRELFWLECNDSDSQYVLKCYDELTAQGIKTSNQNNSSIMYVLGLTDTKPKSPITQSPTTLPDIDYDTDARDPIKNYLVSKYGKNKVSLLGTYNTLKVKGAVKDVVRQIREDMGFEEVNKITKKFDIIKRTDSDAIKEILVNCADAKDFAYITDYSSELAFFYACQENDPELKKWLTENPEVTEAVTQLLGNAKSTGIHAGGIVVSGKDITNIVPLTFNRDEELWVTQPEMGDVEGAGLIKYDFLGLNTGGDLNRCIKLINKRHGTNYTPSNIPLDEKEIFNEFQKGNTVSIFQFSTDLVTPNLSKLKSIDSIMDLAIITSIYRPGPLKMAMDKSFIKRKNGDEKIEYLHPSLESHLKSSYGIFCISENSKVLTKSGQKNIQDVKVGDLVRTEDGSWQKVLLNTYNGEKKTVRIRCTNGEELVCTPDHKVLTQDGWKEAGILTNKDLIKSFWVSEERSIVGTDKDWLAGLAIADGDLTASTINIACSSKEFADKVCTIATKEYNLENAHSKKYGRCWYAVLSQKNGHNGSFSSDFRPNQFIQAISKLGLKDKTCYTKFLPKDYTLSMLAGFIEGDGNLQNNSIRLKNEQLAYEIYLALQSYRITSRYFIDTDGAYTVSFNDYEGKLPFKIKKYRHSKGPAQVYVPRSYIEGVKINFTARSNRKLYQRLSNPKQLRIVSIDIAKELNVNIPHTNWANVLTVKEDSVRKVYDLSVENVHSFVTGGLVTHNCFQEQIMTAVMDLGGISPSDSVVVLKAMGKKLKDKLIKFREKFIKNSQLKYKMDEALATKIWEHIEAFAEYGFNLSHAIAYACVSYLCMWLKTHYPLEWITAVLSGSDKEDFKIMYLHWNQYLQRPNINLSKHSYFINDQDKKVIMPFTAINGVGDKAVDSIIAAQPFVSFEDFYKRIDKRKVNKNVISNLIFSGCFDQYKLPEVSENKWRKYLVKELIALRHADKKPSKLEREQDEKLLMDVENMNRGRILMKEISLLNFTSFDYHTYYKDKMTTYSRQAFGKEASKPHEVLGLPNKAEVVVGGAVDSIKHMPIKSGKFMGKDRMIIRLTNQGGQIDVVIMPWILEGPGGEELRKLEDGMPMIIKGTINIWNDMYSISFKEGVTLV